MPRRHNYNRPTHLGGYNPEKEAASRAEYLARKTTIAKQAEEEMEARFVAQRAAERQARANARAAQLKATMVKQAEEEMEARLEAQRAERQAKADARLQAKLEADAARAAQRGATRDLEARLAARKAELRANNNADFNDADLQAQYDELADAHPEQSMSDLENMLYDPRQYRSPTLWDRIPKWVPWVGGFVAFRRTEAAIPSEGVCGDELLPER